VALVFGLGNPGGRYAHTRHNAGFRVLDELERRLGAREAEPGATYRVRLASRDGVEVALLRPLTYMNESGRALLEWRERHPEDTALLVVADDVYLPVGMLRLRALGGSGGHKGLASVARALGSEEYARLRVGVGAVEQSSELREHVLAEPAAEEAAAYEDSIRVAADAVECWLGEGILAAMNRFNRRVQKEARET
jgi:PTH1 family peptidyl-tRNA hydrolase